MTLLKLTQTLIDSTAVENRAGIVLHTDKNAAEIAAAFIAYGCAPQDDRWAPVSAEAAVADFDDADETGAWYLCVTMDEDYYEFCITADAKYINYVLM